jgi:prevent-host-death family protein
MLGVGIFLDRRQIAVDDTEAALARRARPLGTALTDYYSLIMKAAISILKARLSQYLAAVKAGEEVIVTERGRPVARITAIGADGVLEGRLAKLVREGRVRPPTHGASADELMEGAPPDPDGRSLQELLEDRAEGR